MSKLQLFSLDTCDRLATPSDYDKLDIGSSALYTFTDFKNFKPLVIEANTKATDAHTFLEKAHVEFKIVLGEDNDCVGVISLDGLSEEKIIKHVGKGFKREEILVADLMTERTKIWAFDFEDMQRAKVLDVVESMKQHGLNFGLVVDHRVHEIRGIISAKEIASRFHISFEPNRPPTFLEIFQIIHT